MGNKKTIAVLNSLITINNDRIEGYEIASNQTDELALKNMFAHFISTSQKCKMELVMEVNSLGGDIADGTKISGKIFRAWMDVKAALTGNDRKTILTSCWHGENKAMDTYKIVLENDSEHLSPDQFAMIFSQSSLLKADQYHVKALRNMLIDTPIASQIKSVV